MADTAMALIEAAVMDVVLSREGKRRYSNGDPLTLDPSDLRDIVRLTVAKCVEPSPSTAPEMDERAAFEHHERASDLRRAGVEHDGNGGWYENPCVESAWEGWQARAALASRPAEVDDEGLPAVLFDGHAVYSEITRKLGKAHCHSHETVSATLDAVVRLMRAAPAERAQ